MAQLSDYLNLQQPDEPPVVQVQERQTTGQQAQSAVTKPVTLSWMSDDEYAEQSRIMSPDQLARVYSNYDPQSADPIYQNLYKSTQRQPTVPDDRRRKAASTIAGITDALGLVVQGVTGAKDGLIPLQNQTVTQNNNAYERRMRDIYRQENDRYNSGLFSAAMRDIELGRQGHQADRSKLLGMLDNYRKRKSDAAIAAEKAALDRYKFEEGQKTQRERNQESARHNKAIEGISSRNADTNASRAVTYSQNSTGKGSGVSTPKGYVDYLDPKTNTYYRINEKKLKAFAPQMFKLMEQDIFRGNTSIKRRYDALTPNERLDFVLQNWPDSPAAVKYMEQLKDSKFSAESIEDEETGEKTAGEKKINW